MRAAGRSAIAEFIATFAVVLVSVASFVLYRSGQLDLVGYGLANGLVLAAVVEATARTSHGFANPAVTIGLWIGGRVSGVLGVVLVASQLLASVTAAVVGRFVLPIDPVKAATGGLPLVGTDISVGKAMVLEAALTLILMLVVVGAALGDGRGDRSGGGLAIGAFVAGVGIVFAPWTGAVMNPARWFGPALVTGAWTDWYVWIVGPLAGAAIGAVVAAVAFPRDHDATP